VGKASIQVDLLYLGIVDLRGDVIGAAGRAELPSPNSSLVGRVFASAAIAVSRH